MVSSIAGGDLLSRGTQYHRPRGLNDRVRDGNGCGPAGMATGKGAGRGCSTPPGPCSSSRANDSVRIVNEVCRRWVRDLCRRAAPFSGRGRRWSVNVAKLSTVSTGNLKASRPVQLRPINRVVYPGSLASRRTHGTLVLALASRLDAFSVYPFPTWLPSRAASATTGTPGVGPSESSRTTDESPSRFPHPQQIGTDLAHAGLNPARVPL